MGSSDYSSVGSLSPMRLNNCSENSSPVIRKPAFKINPLCGFDEDSVIVPKKKQRKIAKIPYKVLDAPAL